MNISDLKMGTQYQRVPENLLHRLGHVKSIVTTLKHNIFASKIQN